MKNKLTIMVLDDEECIRDTFLWHLTDLGYTVQAAAEPHQCDVFKGHVCGQDRPCADVLITDNKMPGLKGVELIEMMLARGCQKRPEYKAVMSGIFSRDDLERAERIGCKIFWKPVSFKELEEWLHELELKIEDEAGD